jgi:hypothetical protein
MQDLKKWEIIFLKTYVKFSSDKLPLIMYINYFKSD